MKGMSSGTILGVVIGTAFAALIWRLADYAFDRLGVPKSE